MLLPLTPRSEQALKLAEEEARAMSHNHYGTGHLLLGLLKEGSGIAANVLRDLGMEVNAIRSCIKSFIVADGKSQSSPRLVFVDDAIKQAATEAEKLGHKWVGTEHLLLGLFKSGRDSNRVLSYFKIEEKQVRDEVIRLLGKETKEEDMFERFTDRAHKIMQLANQNAQKYDYEFIDTIHIFLGMLQEGSGVACKAIADVGQANALHRLQTRTERDLEINRGPQKVIMGKLPQTPMAKSMIEKAIAEARELKANYIGSEHFLLAFLQNRESFVRALLAAESIRYDAVKKWLVDWQKKQLEASVVKQEAQKDADKKEDEGSELEVKIDDAINAFVEHHVQAALKKEREEILNKAVHMSATIHGEHDQFVMWLRNRMEGKNSIYHWAVTTVIGTPILGDDDGKEDHKDH